MHQVSYTNAEVNLLWPHFTLHLDLMICCQSMLVYFSSKCQILKPNIKLDLDNDKIITHESCSTTVIKFQVSDLIRSSLITSFVMIQNDIRHSVLSISCQPKS